MSPSGIVGLGENVPGKAHDTLEDEAFRRGDLSTQRDSLFAGFDSRSVEAHIQVDEHTDRYAASLCSIGEKFGSGLGVDTDGE
jgi:hypothetical protein